MSDKITIQICSFGVPSKSAGKLIQKESVKRVINSEKFKTNLEKGRVLSLISHSDRYVTQNEHIPYEDQILISPYLAGYGKRAWIDESKNTFMGEIELADNDNGRLIKDMLKKGFDVGTSMSVSATADSNYYYIDDILSLGDFTLRPDLEAKIIKVDFSEKVAPNGKSNLITFSQVIKNKDIVCDFSEDEPEEQTICPKCGCDVDECTCHTVKKLVPGVRREGNLSQSNCPRPTVTPTDNQKTDPNKVMPVENTAVGSTEVVTNLNEIAGEDVENIQPENFTNSKLAKSLGIADGDNLEVSMEEIHEDIPVENQLTKQELAELPNAMTAAVQFSIKTNFTLQQYLQEQNRPPHVILKRRVDEVVQMCRSKKQGWITANLDRLRAYFESYIFTWIMNSINSPDKDFNIFIKLRMAVYGLQNSQFRELRIAIRRMKEEQARTGFITKPTQQRLNTAFQGMIAGMYKYIDDKINKFGVTFFPEESEEKE